MAFSIKPLNHEEYSIKIIKDLGRIYNERKTRKSRFAIVECPDCKKHFKLRMGSAMAKKQKKCNDCNRTKHGYYKHPLYPIWNSMIQRCYNPKRKDYHKYGAKGVTVCDEWKKTPTEFIQWAENNGWEVGLELDKDIKSFEKNMRNPIYSPDTCIFVTQEENINFSNSKKVKQYSLNMEYIATYDSCVKAALSLGKNKSAKSLIAACARGVNKTSLGFIWKYV